MENIILVSGKVKYPITLEPGVWIFDDRRIDLTTYFISEHTEANKLEEYTKAVSKHWDREIMEGAVFPPTLKTERKFEKEKVLTGTFGIAFSHFLKNAEPSPDASKVVVKTEDEEIEMPMAEAEGLILGFSENGQPITTGGPVNLYYGDGRNQKDPIKNVRRFIVK